MNRGLRSLRVSLIILSVGLLLLQQPVASDQVTTEDRRFDKVVLISVDGGTKSWIDYLIAQDELPNLERLRNEGVEMELRITSHVTKTDPGLAAIETGYGAKTTGVTRNTFGAGSEKLSVPDGLTITERIKSLYGSSWKTGLFFPWSQGETNVTDTMDATYWNQKEETDVWFSPEVLAWSQSNETLRKNSLSSDGLLRANFTATMVSKFIERYAHENFYIRTHWTEPDYTGHAHSDHTVEGRIGEQYRNALKDCDAALGIVISTLEKFGVYEDTLILFTSDHGFWGAHGGEGYPLENHNVSVVPFFSNYAGMGNDLGWGLQVDIAPTILASVGIDVASLEPSYSETSGAMSLWLASPETRDTDPPLIGEVAYSESVAGGQIFNVTVNLSDESGIEEAVLLYEVEGFGKLAQVTMDPSTPEHWSGGINVHAALENRVYHWYLAAIDSSPQRNGAFYPSPTETLQFTPVQGDTEPSPQTDYYVFIYLALGAAVLIGSVVLLRRRAFSLQREQSD